MKVINTDYNHWEIITNGKVVGNIRRFEMFRGSRKNLYVGDSDKKKIGEIKNQADAIEKLKKFFVSNKVEIEKLERLIEELTIGITQVGYQICIYAINKERDRLCQELEKLNSYDLI